MTLRCVAWGQFISYGSIGRVEFTPDNDYSIEKIKYVCVNCTEEDKK